MSAQPNLPLDGWINTAISKQLPQARRSFSLDDAVVLADFARHEAQDCGVAVVFSLIDGSGNARYFFSMDDALLVSYSLACQKAWTAVALKMATHELAEQVQPGGDLFGLQHEKGICSIGGGLPCWSDGVLLGAIGISGGTVEQDLTIARRALRRFSAERYMITASR